MEKAEKCMWKRQYDRKYVGLNVTPSHSMESQGLHPGKLVAHGVGEVGSEPAILKTVRRVYMCRRYS